MKPSGEYSAFVSYASENRDKADDICASLEAHGLVCWIAPRDVRAGREYADEIIRGLEHSAAVVLVLSEAANASVFVRREIERAVSKQKPVFPVRIEEVLPSPGLELFISGTHWLDAWQGRWDDHMDRLARDLGDTPTATPVSHESSGRRSVPDRRSFPLAYVASGLALVVALSGMAIWWFSGERPLQVEPGRRQIGSAPVPVQNSSPPAVREPPQQVEAAPSRPVELFPATRGTGTRSTTASTNKPTVRDVRPTVGAAEPTPATVEASSALNGVRDDYDSLSIRGGAIDDALNQLWEDMKPNAPRVDMVTHQRSLRANLARSKEAIAEKDASGARRYLDLARTHLDALEQFLNR